MILKQEVNQIFRLHWLPGAEWRRQFIWLIPPPTTIISRVFVVEGEGWEGCMFMCVFGGEQEMRRQTGFITPFRLFRLTQIEKEKIYYENNITNLNVI